MNPGQPPTRDELIEVDGLDERCVVEHFLGKSQAEARLMFELQPSCAEDFMWMAAAGVAYYLEPAVEYLQSDAADGDWEFCTYLLGGLVFHLTESNDLENSVRVRIKGLADYIRSNLAKFRIESDDPVPQYLDEIDAAVKSE